jgi:hypothetical protein
MTKATREDWLRRAEELDQMASDPKHKRNRQNLLEAAQMSRVVANVKGQVSRKPKPASKPSSPVPNGSAMPS